MSVIKNISNKFDGHISILPPLIRTLVLYPDKDSVILEKEPWSIYGDYSTMQVTPTKENPTVKVLFNFSGMHKLSILDRVAIKDAKLEFTKVSSPRYSSNISVAQYHNGDKWYEQFVCWNNAPVQGEEIITNQLVSSKTKRFTIDITDDIKQRIVLHDDAGYAIYSSDDPEDYILDIYSKEARTINDRPKLIIRYFASIGNPVSPAEIYGNFNSLGLVGHTTYITDTGAIYPELYDIPASETITSTTYENIPEIIGEFTSSDKYGRFAFNPDDKSTIIGEMVVPKFFANKIDYFVDENKVYSTFTNNIARDWITERFEILHPTLTPDYTTSNIDINGTVNTLKSGGTPDINGSMEVWKGSVFKFTFRNKSDDITYEGIEPNRIALELEDPNNVNIISEGDLINGSVSYINEYVRDFPLGVLKEKGYAEISGVVYSESYIDIDPTTGMKDPDFFEPVIIGKVLNPIPYTSILSKDFMGEIQFDHFIDYTEISGTVSIDPLCEYPAVPEISGSFYVSKIFAFETSYSKDNAEVYKETTDMDWYTQRIEILDPAKPYDISNSMGDLINGRVPVLYKYDSDEFVGIVGTVYSARTIDVGPDGTIIDYNYPEINGEVHSVWDYITTPIYVDNDSSKDIDHVINKDYTEINGDIDVLYNYTESKEGHKDNTTIIGTNTIVLQPYNIDINIIDPDDESNNEIIKKEFAQINGNTRSIATATGWIDDSINQENWVVINGDLTVHYLNSSDLINGIVNPLVSINVDKDGNKVPYPTINGLVYVVYEYIDTVIRDPNGEVISIESIDHTEINGSVSQVLYDYCIDDNYEEKPTIIDGNVKSSSPINTNTDGTEISDFEWPQIEGKIRAAWEYTYIPVYDSSDPSIIDHMEYKDYTDINAHLNTLALVSVTYNYDKDGTMIGITDGEKFVPNTEYTEYERPNMEICGTVISIGKVGIEFAHFEDSNKELHPYDYDKLNGTIVDEKTGELVYNNLWEEYIFECKDLVIDYLRPNMELSGRIDVLYLKMDIGITGYINKIVRDYIEELRYNPATDEYETVKVRDYTDITGEVEVEARPIPRTKSYAFIM